MQSISLSELLKSGLSDNVIADRIASNRALLAAWQAHRATYEQREAESVGALEDAERKRESCCRSTIETGIIRWGLKYKIRVWISRRWPDGGRYVIVGMASTLREARQIRRQMIATISEGKPCHSRQRRIRRSLRG